MRHFRSFVLGYRGLPALLSVVTLVFALGCTSKSSRKIRIGWIGPLTGEGAPYGVSIQKGVNLAVDEVNAKRGIDGRQVEVIFEDSRGLPKSGVDAMHKLVNVDRVPVVIGAVFSSVTLACAPIANETRTVLLSSISSNYKIADAGDYVFRVWPSDAQQGIGIAQLAYKLEFRRAAVIYISTDYGVGLDGSFTDGFVELGGSVVYHDEIAQGATDMRTVLTKAKEKRPDVYFCPVHAKEGGRLIKQARQLGIKNQFLMSDGFTEQSGIDVAGEAAEGIILPSLAHGDPRLYGRFAKEFRSEYGHDPSDNAAAGYDAAKVVLLAIEQGGYTADGIKHALYEMQYEGVTGDNSFDQQGEVSKKYGLFVVTKGRLVPYQENKEVPY